MEALVLFVIFIIILSLYYLSKAIVIVPARKMAIVERMGLYQRTLMPGMYLLFYPFEYLRKTWWSYRNQNNRLCRVSECHISNDLQQMDIPPIKCVSLETAPITVDVVIMYKITDLPKAMYETGDVLNLFYQAVHQSVRDVCAQYSIERLQGKDVNMSTDMINYATKLMGDIGIKCISILVQDVSLGSDVLEARKTRFQAEEARKRKMDELKYQEEVQKREQNMLLQKAKSEAEQLQIRYFNNGLTPNHYVALKQCKWLSKASNVTVFLGDGKIPKQTMLMK